MIPTEPIISIIIPVEDSGALLRLLDGLRAQTHPLHQVEILIAATGDTDDLAELCRPYEAGLPLRLIEPGGQTIAEALNCGIAAASGKLLLFLDNQVEPTPPLIEAHVQAHQVRPGCVVMGAYTVTFPGAAGFLTITLRAWWEDRFYAMRRPAHRYSYRDLVGGNFSIEAAILARLGNFDPAFGWGVDYELGLRLLKAGIPFTFVSEACCHYTEPADVECVFRRAGQEGRLSFLLEQRYPELGPVLPQTHFGIPRFSRKHRLHRVVHTLAFSQSGPGEFIATCLGRLLPLIEKARLRRQWRLLFRSLCIFWYWRGMAKELDRQPELSGPRQDNPAQIGVDASKIELDLRLGLAAAEQRLDQDRPAAMRVYYGEHFVGRIAPQPGAEPLRGIHLHSILATDLAKPLVAALALDRTQDHLAEPDGSFAIAPQLVERRTSEGVLAPISVIVCTCGQMNELKSCLQALLELDYPNYEIIVVDYGLRNNGSDLLATRWPVRYIYEGGLGLSGARNRGVAEARYDIVAFIGEDTCPDGGWLLAIADALSEPDIKAVTGLVTPTALETPAQIHFDRIKTRLARGLRQRRTISRTALTNLAWSRDNALVACDTSGNTGYGQHRWVWRAETTDRELLWEGALGPSNNMAFRRQIFAVVGPFEMAPDCVTTDDDGGAKEMFLRLAAQGYTLVYDPSILVKQTYPRDMASLRRSIYDQGRNLGTYLLICARNRTITRSSILHFALREWLGRWLLRRLIWPGKLPRLLVALELAGAIVSPLAYGAARRRARRYPVSLNTNGVVLDPADFPVFDRPQP